MLCARHLARQGAHQRCNRGTHEIQNISNNCPDLRNGAQRDIGWRPRLRRAETVAADGQHQQSVQDSRLLRPAAALTLHRQRRRPARLPSIQPVRRRRKRQRCAGSRLIGQQQQHASSGQGLRERRLCRLCAGHTGPRRIRPEGPDRLCGPAGRRYRGIHESRDATATGHPRRLLVGRGLRAQGRRFVAARTVPELPAALALPEPELS